MFVVNKNHPPILTNYGIDLPVPPGRFINCKNWITQNIDPTQIVYLSENIFTEQDLMLAHTKEYAKALINDPDYHMRLCFELTEFPKRFIESPNNRPMHELAESIIYHSGGTYLACKLALDHQCCIFSGGGYHHAMSFGPRGFCLINDIVIAIRKLQTEKKIKTAWVIDVDAHKGDGTAELTQNDETIITLSIHMKDGWPLNQGPVNSPWFIPSNLDIAISSHDANTYNEQLVNGLNLLKEKYAGPDLVIVNQGTDPYEKDTLPSTSLLNLTLEQLKERDTIVYNFFKKLKIPQVYVLSGGYGPFAHEPTLQFWDYLLGEKLWMPKNK